MPHEPRHKKEQQSNAPASDPAMDTRIEYGQPDEERDDLGPSPYDLAPDDAPDAQVIHKGERERPGPTDHLEHNATGALADDDGLLQANQIDREAEFDFELDDEDPGVEA